jgi:hypothetical protein
MTPGRDKDFPPHFGGEALAFPHWPCELLEAPMDVIRLLTVRPRAQHSADALLAEQIREYAGRRVAMEARDAQLPALCPGRCGRATNRITTRGSLGGRLFSWISDGARIPLVTFSS